MREGLVGVGLGQVGEVPALERPELRRADLTVVVGVRDRQERGGECADGQLRGGRVSGQCQGGFQELFLGDRGAAAGDMR